MPKYKVVYERDKCIGAAGCVAAYEKRWTLADDGKADLEGGKKANEHWELEIDESELEDMKKAAEACPVTVIHIEDEEGNRII